MENTMHAHPASSHQVVQRYFQMWNTGDTSAAPEVLSPDWTDHAHPEVNGPADVQRAVTQTHATRPGLRFYIDTILGTDDLLSVVGGVGHESHPGAIDSRLIWLIRLLHGQMVEMWTYRLSTP
jgi:ketosteroid isomerase-like protein